MMIWLLKLLIDVAYPVTIACMILILIKIFQLLDVALDIVNKNVPRRVTSKRAEKIFKQLKILLIIFLLAGIATLISAINHGSPEEIEFIHTYTIGGGLGYGCI